MASSKYGDKYTCFKCGIKFYTMGKPDAICPKCETNQKKAPKRVAAKSVVTAPKPPPVVEEEPDSEEDAPADSEIEFPAKDAREAEFDPKTDRMSIDGVPDQDF